MHYYREHFPPEQLCQLHFTCCFTGARNRRFCGKIGRADGEYGSVVSKGGRFFIGGKLSPYVRFCVMCNSKRLDASNGCKYNLCISVFDYVPTLENRSKQPRRLTMQYTSGSLRPFPLGCQKGEDEQDVVLKNKLKLWSKA